MERARGELLAVEEDLEVEVALLGERERGRIGAVALVGGLHLDGSVRRLDDELVSAELLVVAVLVARLDGEGEAREARGGVVGSRAALELEGRVLDGMVLERDLDGDGAGLLSGIV